jgi:hypothetical protein
MDMITAQKGAFSITITPMLPFHRGVFIEWMLPSGQLFCYSLNYYSRKE